ncbi:hypothetical protein ABW19_dt0205573 [Dactylella cylindrospora]|nr:hypothetical protein ABW19_dt0205573 [Dactylella cylindrospora]
MNLGRYAGVNFKNLDVMQVKHADTALSRRAGGDLLGGLLGGVGGGAGLLGGTLGGGNNRNQKPGVTNVAFLDPGKPATITVPKGTRLKSVDFICCSNQKGFSVLEGKQCIPVGCSIDAESSKAVKNGKGKNIHENVKFNPASGLTPQTIKFAEDTTTATLSVADAAKPGAGKRGIVPVPGEDGYEPEQGEEEYDGYFGNNDDYYGRDWRDREYQLDFANNGGNGGAILGWVSAATSIIPLILDVVVEPLLGSIV